ncbi:hypothetical protein ACQKWADRAFT_128453 [Trichoderma austrokoningii]
MLSSIICLVKANEINNTRPTAASPPPWRGSGLLSSMSSNVYETPTSSADEYTSLEPYSLYDTAYPLSATPRPQYSAIVTVRTTTWVISRSTTITSIIFETYYSTLTDVESSAEAGTVTVTTASPPSSTECTTASGYASVYVSGCSSSSSSSSASASSSSSSMSMVTMTWSPEVTAYPPPSSSNDQGASPASTSSPSSSGSTTTTTTTTAAAAAASSSNEAPPVVTGGAGSIPQAAEVRTLGVVAALLAMLL